MAIAKQREEASLPLEPVQDQVVVAVGCVEQFERHAQRVDLDVARQTHLGEAASAEQTLHPVPSCLFEALPEYQARTFISRRRPSGLTCSALLELVHRIGRGLAHIRLGICQRLNQKLDRTGISEVP